MTPDARLTAHRAADKARTATDIHEIDAAIEHYEDAIAALEGIGGDGEGEST